MSDKQGVEIDYCPECRGIWLDRGELDKIISRSTQNYEDQPRNQGHSNEHHYEKQYKHNAIDQYGHHCDKRHNKKSFLQDIFDFG
jgi:hypothetical protein